jgi:hypothetical protein
MIKTKIVALCMIATVFLVMCTRQAVADDGLEELLQGVWFHDDYIITQIFCNGKYGIFMYGHPFEKGTYTVTGNIITREPTHFTFQTGGGTLTYLAVGGIL